MVYPTDPGPGRLRRHTYQRQHGELLTQLQRSTTAAQQAGQLAQQAQSLAQSQGSDIQSLQASLQAAQSQLDGLDQAFQMLTDSGSDLVLINDIDQLVSLASQQLILGGNVANAIVAMETAQARLARANRNNLASLQQALNGDLDRLRAVATVDVSQVSRQLDQLNGLLAEAPLLVPDAAVPGVATDDVPAKASGSAPQAAYQADPNAPWWRNTLGSAWYWTQSTWHDLRQDMAGFIQVRRVDDKAALLISPDQAAQLRQTLHLRILTAQLGLMMRQPQVWQSELQAILHALDTRFDTQSRVTQRAVRQAERLAEIQVDAKLPTLENSMHAIEALRAESTKALERRREASPVEPNADMTDAPVPDDSAPSTEPAEAGPAPAQSTALPVSRVEG